jgi:RNA polymerase sigma-32 factor
MTPHPEQRVDDALAVHQFNAELSRHLGAFGATLEGREEYIFQRRLMTESPMTLQEIGEEFGLSRERVRQVEARLLDKLRTYLLQNMGEHFDIAQGA